MGIYSEKSNIAFVLLKKKHFNRVIQKLIRVLGEQIIFSPTVVTCLVEAKHRRVTPEIRRQI